MRHFATTNDLSGVIKRTSVTLGATLISKISQAEAAALALIPTYFTATVEPNPGTDNTFKIAFSNEPVRGKYAFGTVVTVTTQAGFVIDTVLVNGEAVEAAEGIYAFAITEPVDIDVTTSELFTVTLPGAGNFEAELSTEAVNGEYVDGTILTVTPATGYSITDLKLNGETVISADGTYAIEISADSVIVITTAASYLVTLTPATGDFTVVFSTEDIGGRYVTGTTVEIEAAEGFTITALTLNATPVTDVAGVYTITVTADSAIAITTAVQE